MTAQAANYTDFMPGAKAMGMGYAFASVADDPSAVFFNPAGLANAPYTQTGGTLGRHSSPVGNMAYGGLSYFRPYEPINTATIGMAYLTQRQRDSGDIDHVIFHFSREFKVPYVPLDLPLKFGSNFKFINAEQGRGAGFGFGFDVGALVRTKRGINFGLVMRDLTSNVGLPRPVITLAVSQTIKKRVLLAADLRVRSNLTEFYPGIEVSFFQGLLKTRMGRGLKLDYADSVAFGVGLNFSPVIIDLAMTMPTAGINRAGGAYQASFNYRFGAPPFSGNFVGQAAIEADQLGSRIQTLRKIKKDLQKQGETALTERNINRGQLKSVVIQLEKSSKELRLLKRRHEETQYELKRLQRKIPKAKPKPKPAPPPPPPWPRYHKVRAGETMRSIADLFYGDPAGWERIYRVNRDKVDRGLPKEGAVLLIPAPKR